MKKIIFFKGLLETLDYFIDKLILGAKQLGIEYYIADAKNEESFSGEAIHRFVQSDNVVAFMINQIGMNLNESGENFWDKYNIPVYNLIVDHPYNYADSLDNPPQNIHVFVIDKDHESFIRKYYPKIKNIHFMPNGGWEVQSDIPFEERKIDIFYAGDCNKAQPWIKIPYFEDGGQEFYQFCYTFGINNSFMPIENIIEIYCEQKGNISFEMQKKIILEYAFILMHNIRRYFKLQVMHALEATGAYIEIRGNGWTDADTWKDNVHIHNRVSSEECNRLCGNAKIGLNFMPWYKQGCSERVFNIMLNASVCLTDVSSYLLERFEHGKEMVFFNYDDIDGVVKDVKFLLANPKIAKRIATTGYSVAINNDTWIHRMMEINKVMNQ